MRHSVPSPPAAVVSCHVEQPLATTRGGASTSSSAPARRLRRDRADASARRGVRRGRGAVAQRARAPRRRARRSACTRTGRARRTRGRRAAIRPSACGARRSGCARRGSSRASSAAAAGTRTTTCSATVRELGLVDCTVREGAPCRGGAADDALARAAGARASLGPLPPYVHAYFHDYDLLDSSPADARSLVALHGARSPTPAARRPRASRREHLHPRHEARLKADDSGRRRSESSHVVEIR